LALAKPGEEWDMETKAVLFDQDTAHILNNLYTLYLHDLSEFDGAFPNEHGVFDEEQVRTLAEQAEAFSYGDWLKTPDHLYPFLILADGRPAGFNFIATHPYSVPEHVDYMVHEFFLLHAYRGKGVGEAAATQVFERLRGKWEVFAMPNNPRAQGFWRRTISHYTGGQYHEELGPTVFGERVIFRFSNKN